jgi:hypothetical protein
MKNKTVTTVLIALISFPLFSLAQTSKLQNSGINTVDSIIIDGQAYEWKDPYQFYNKATEVYYKIANNNNQLYFFIHAVHPRIIEKILEGGISINIFPEKKRKSEPVTVLFPLLPLTVAKDILVKAGKPPTGSTMLRAGEDISQSLKDDAKDKNLVSIDKANNMLLKNLKEIKVQGVDEVTDTITNVQAITPYYRELPLRKHKFKLLAIKNMHQIEAMAQFDDKGELTIEISLPLDFLPRLSENTLYYDITVNGRGLDGRPGNTIMYSPPPSREILYKDLENSTNFLGEYVLAR